MRCSRFATLRLGALTAIVACVAGSSLHAAAEQPVVTQSIALPLGAIFEILAQNGEASTQYAWTLSVDRTFLQAERGRSFRTRFSQPGRYLLSTEMLQSGGRGARASFTITVRQDVPQLPEPSEAFSSDPAPSEGGMIVLPSGTALVRIAPRSDLQDVWLDADSKNDEDGDGDRGNDRSTNGTLFGSDHVPLWIWMTDEPPSTIIASGTLPDGSLAQTRFLMSQEGVVAQPVEKPVGDAIQMEDRGSGVVRFGIDPATVGTGVIPLAVWDFGDGKQSMVSNPVHRYAASGSYSVRLRITDLRNGTTTQDVSRTVSVIVESKQLPAQELQPSESTATPSNAEKQSIFPLILRITGALIGSVLLGAIVMMLVGFIRKKHKGLEEKLAAADKKMAIGKEAAKASVVEGTATPLTMPDTEEQEEPQATTPAPTIVPQQEILGPAPAWLNPEKRKTTPPESPTPKPPTPAKVDAPQTTEKTIPSAPSAKLQAAPVPQVAPPPEAPPPPAAAAVAPMPVATPAPKPTIAPSPSPVGATAIAEEIHLPAPVSPAAAAPPVVPAPTTAATPLKDMNGDGDLPQWLRPAKAETTSVPPSSVTTPTPQATPPARVSEGQTAPAPLAIDERERERRRLKRQRYRANKRRREAQNPSEPKDTGAPSAPAAEAPAPKADDIPVAIVRAEHLKEPPPPPKVMEPPKTAP
jgi:PKD repeat protein